MNNHDDWICILKSAEHANTAIILDWCEKNFNVSNWHTDGYSHRYYFRRRDDATLFALRWA